ncbi:hypothetical protein P152DRAFT_460489 [Eremomyces bilateralis CBS 781.70]|uniref:CoA-binding domain-containing protein n=1 Tax=Eremomyces bilateralis CBS 781.70 TaxID=1392243 RepID=A0A6G1FX58_9PEZI|nr:uncharacterized protein P152DRAFT_460489 [Eremomyces bilateralis CBS 781.70]KAF1810373.1 hypothetical protein P152DRAFT_460489 [Eremomyces bilateralis CBS 781.70]
MLRSSRHLLSSPSIPHSARLFSSSAVHHDYSDTIGNLKIGKDTRVIFQGFTGRQATANAKQSIEWGTNIVGGVRPGKEGEHLGLPVLPSVRKAKELLNPHATGIYVAAHQATGAIEEAIEAEIPLIVAVAEHIPLHDILRIHSVLQTQSKSRLVGANSPGIISALGHCRIGFQPLPTFLPGHVGIIAKSGTLGYETVASLTREGLGQSLCIGMGGDVVAGTNFVDGLRLFEHDDDTEAIIIVGEVGGRAEEDAAEWIADYKRRTANPKPIAALVGGMCAKPGYVMGHAGAWAAPGESSSWEKFRALENAGVAMVDHPSKFGGVMKTLLANSGRNVEKINQSASAAQRRGYHTSSRRTPVRPTLPSATPHVNDRRSLHISADQAGQMLSSRGFPVSADEPTPSDSQLLVLTVDRTARTPCIIASPTTNPSGVHKRAAKFPFDHRAGPTSTTVSAILNHLQLGSAPPTVQSSVGKLINSLYDIYTSHEAVSLSVHVSLSPPSESTPSPPLQITSPNFSFDDAAFRSCKRHADLHTTSRVTTGTHPTELAAEPHGIVYVHLTNPDARIGTLVNGAGLAMNTVDALAARGGQATNFLDTGGKATSDTVKTSFELILRDERVKVVFVNIFGGLTLGDMIAEGVIKAFRELGLDKEGAVPVVVRIRGTNEEAGQTMIKESGLPLYAFIDFEEAAAKAIELAGR